MDCVTLLLRLKNATANYALRHALHRIYGCVIDCQSVILFRYTHKSNLFSIMCWSLAFLLPIAALNIIPTFEGIRSPEEASVVDEPELGVAPRQYTSSLVLTCAQFSGEKTKRRLYPSHPTLQIWLQRTLFFFCFFVS